MIKCEKCRFGEINFWGYQECWKFDRQIDLEKTKHTANREKNAIELNRHNDCELFEKYSLVHRMIHRMKIFSNDVFYSIIKLLKIQKSI